MKYAPSEPYLPLTPHNSVLLERRWRQKGQMDLWERIGDGTQMIEIQETSPETLDTLIQLCNKPG